MYAKRKRILKKIKKIKNFEELLEIVKEIMYNLTNLGKNPGIFSGNPIRTHLLSFWPLMTMDKERIDSHL